MPRGACLLLLITTTCAAVEPSPFTPTRITLDAKVHTLSDALAAFRAAGLAVEAPTLDGATPCAVTLADAPAWEALEAVADRTGTRIALRDHGRRITLVKREAGREPSSVHGPFRVAAREVAGRLDLESGTSYQEVRLEVHWEPRFPVFRIDSVPTITVATDDLGHALEAASASALSPVTDAASHALPVRLRNVPRKAQRVAILAGHFAVTASERMLPFAFDLGGQLPVAGTLPADVPAPLRDSVQATLRAWQRETLGGKTWWEAQIHLAYPSGMPAFQSFETWLGENKLRLVSPARTAYAPEQTEEPGAAREMTVVYRFDAAKLGAAPPGKGWSLVYDTPAPLVEFRVPFALKDVPLP